MTITDRQRRILLLGIGCVLLALLLLGGLHHHDGHTHNVCWYCIATAGALLPTAVLLSLPVTPLPPHRFQIARGTARFLWSIHPRRGPPQFV